MCVCVCLQKMGVLHVGQQIEEQVAFGKMFKNGSPPPSPSSHNSGSPTLKVLDVNLICFSSCSHAAWADNADACAKQYAGTGALKTDFTRSDIKSYFKIYHKDLKYHHWMS